jgi:predicted ArsR family transcriptional regulator
VAPTQAAALSREFADVCDAVAEHLETTVPDPETAARDIGARWGRRMMDLLPTPEADEPAGEELVEVEAGRIRLLMSSLGYQARAEERPTLLTLHQCPLRTEGNMPVPLVCQMHRGMLDEMLATLSGGRVEGKLVRLAGPDYCTVELRSAP